MAGTKTVAIIPARGGSNGLPGKNVRPLAGKPLIHYTIEAALGCPQVEAVYVSTDDTDIQRASEESGASVIRRPAHLATDEANSMDVIRHFLEVYETQNGGLPETLVLLQPTSPLRTAAHLREALEKYDTLPQPASLISVTLTKPIAWQGTSNSQGHFESWKAVDLSSNRQNETSNYLINGAIYVSTPQRYVKGELMTPFVYAYMMPTDASVDIDTLQDFELAEFYMQKRYARALSGEPS